MIAINITRLGLNLRRGGFSSLFLNVTITVGICPSDLFLYLNIKRERFHLTFKVFILTRCISIIHLSLSASCGTMRCLALFLKVSRAVRRALCSLGSPVFFQCLDVRLGYLLEVASGYSSVSTDPPGSLIVSWLNF